MSRFARAAGLAALSSVLLTACSGGAAPSASGPAASGGASPAATAAGLAAPVAIREAGRIVWCTDISYAPEEFYADDGTTAQGSDIDIAARIAEYWGVASQVDNTAFDGIIPALLAKKCDAIISGMSVTDERKAQVDFVEYLEVGQGLLVPAGNPKGIHTLDDLSGRAVAVQLGTWNEDVLESANEDFAAAGKALIDITTFEKDTDAFLQLSLGRVDVFATDSPVVAYYNSKPENAGKFEVAGEPIEPGAIGIATRREDAELTSAVRAAVDEMYADGSLRAIVERWGMTDSVVFLR